MEIWADKNQIACPAHAKVEVISKVSEDGRVEEKNVLGMPRSARIRDVLRDEEWAERFVGGDYVKLYLAPWDLHYLVFPAPGRISHQAYRSGWALPLLFMKRGDVLNERLCVVIETVWGFPMAVVMIGSWMVNGIHHVFEPEEEYSTGDDFGHFKVGSSVVLLFPPGVVEWECGVGDKLGIGDRLARVLGE